MPANLVNLNPPSGGGGGLLLKKIYKIVKLMITLRISVEVPLSKENPNVDFSTNGF
jgi:hypothetical protein